MFAVLLAFYLASYALAATADEWRGRSMYQLIVDRFAIPSGASKDCDASKQLRCGGTWSALQDQLDYIQDAGFTAVWISPVSQNIDDTTAYGQAYHGYWTADISQLNSHMGTADDLKALSDELHKRKMFLMVDVVVNNVAATSTNPDYSKYLFKDASSYHSYCPIQWGNTTSEQNCWLGDEKVPLPDVDTTNPKVIESYHQWIKQLVSDYSIDGLRIDAAKHVNKDFWPGFCQAAGVFCIGEVFSDINMDIPASYQGSDGLDSVLNFPLREALSQAFAIPGPGNISALSTTFQQAKSKFKDVSVLGNFVENHDLPRWNSFSVDIQSLYNAMTFYFMTDGIPIVYYGQEQRFSGVADPQNREPLWPSNYEKTDAYQFIANLNMLRNYLVTLPDWLNGPAELLSADDHGIAIIKGNVISIMTNIGSPPQNGTHIAVQSPYNSSTALINVLTCQQWVVGAGGMLSVEYTKGGVPVIVVPSVVLKNSKICTDVVDETDVSAHQALTSSAQRRFSISLFLLVAFLPSISFLFW